MEGTAWPLLQRWCRLGRLPGLAALLEHGANGSLKSDFVPYEPPGLMTAFSGHPVGEHGWYSYWTAHAEDYSPRVLTSAEVIRPLLWHRPEFQSERFAVINVCGTHPPTELPGWLISYPMQQSLRATQPESLLRELSRRGIHIVHDVSVWYAGQARERFLSGVLRADRERCQAALYCSREGADVLILNLTAIDRVSHFYWHELETESPIPEEESAIFQAYESCDRCLQTLMKEAGPEANVLVFSEIGFGPLRAYYSVNAALAAAGILRWQYPPPLMQVDWSASAAFEAVQGTHGVNINLKGRYREGTVSVEDYETARRDAMSALHEALNPHTGLALFARVLPREEVYRGAAVEKAPDILLEPADQRYLPLGDPLWAHKVNRTWQSGWHRAESFWAGQGAAFKPGKRSTSATPLDVAPTIARMLGREPAAEWPGASLTEEP